MAETQQQGSDGRSGAEGFSTPGPGEAFAMPIAPGDVVVIRFDLESVRVSLEADDLVFSFTNGGRIVLEGFAEASDGDEPPALQLPGGVLVAGDVIVDQLLAEADLELVEPAAGETEEGAADEGNVEGEGSGNRTQSVAELVGFIETLVIEGAVPETAFMLSPRSSADFDRDPDSNLVLLLLSPPQASVAAPALVQLAAGFALEGYLEGSLLFADLNGDGNGDPEEFLAQTGRLGTFPLPSEPVPLVLELGVDISLKVPFVDQTGSTQDAPNLAFRGTLRAPAGSEIISPLTTLVSEILDEPVLSQAQAEWIVVSGLALGSAPGGPAPTPGSLTTFDPILQSVEGGGLAIVNPANPGEARAMTGKELQTAVAKVENTVVQVASLITGASSPPVIVAQAALAEAAPVVAAEQVDFKAVFRSVYEILALKLRDIAPQSEDPLIDKSFVKMLIEDSAEATFSSEDGRGFLDGAVVDAAAELIVVLNERANSARDAGDQLNGNAFLGEIAKVSTVAQTDLEEVESPLLEALQEGSAGTLRQAGAAGRSDPNGAVDQINAFNANVDNLIDNVDPGDVSTNGDDEVIGTADPDNLSGNDGDDTLSGLDGDDLMFGGPGSDTLIGGKDDDTLLGDSESDRFRFDFAGDGFGNDIAFDFLASEDILEFVNVEDDPRSDGAADLTGLDKLIDTVTVADLNLGGPAADVLIDFRQSTLTLVDLGAFTSFTDLEAANPGSVVVIPGP